MAEKSQSHLLNVLQAARQESEAFLQGGIRINDVCWYHLSNEYPGQIGIHLFATDIGKTLSEAKAFLNKYRQGLDVLAHLLETDQTLASITHITGWSRLVYEHPNLLASVGFEVTERDEEKKEALAIMTREEFLKRPWRKA